MVLALLVAGVAFTTGHRAEAATDLQGLGATSWVRAVMTRSGFWVDHPVPYSQTAYAPDLTGQLYRTDCSGFVSMAWGLDRSYSTRTLGTVTHPITKDALGTGDALLSYDNHVVLFVRWVDAAHTKYVGREQTSALTAAGTPLNTVERVIPYPFFTKQSTYVPVRVNTGASATVPVPALASGSPSTNPSTSSWTGATTGISAGISGITDQAGNPVTTAAGTAWVFHDRRMRKGTPSGNL